MKKKDPTSHRIIEKRRRDRMNNCLADLSKLIPTHYMKKGRGRIEKTEIIEMAIKYLKDLIVSSNVHKQQANNNDNYDPSLPAQMEGSSSSSTMTTTRLENNGETQQLSTSDSSIVDHHHKSSPESPLSSSSSSLSSSLSSTCEGSNELANNSCSSSSQDLHAFPPTNFRPISSNPLASSTRSISKRSMDSKGSIRSSLSSSAETSSISGSSMSSIWCCSCGTAMPYSAPIANSASGNSLNVLGKSANSNNSNIFNNSLSHNNLTGGSTGSNNNGAIMNGVSSLRDNQIDMKAENNNCHATDDGSSRSSAGWYKKAWLVRSFSHSATQRDRL